MIETEKIDEIVFELQEKIDHWYQSDSQKYGVEIIFAKNLLKSIKRGSFDEVLNSIYWYNHAVVDSEHLIKWQINRNKLMKKGIEPQKLTPENYAVYYELQKLLTYSEEKNLNLDPEFKEKLDKIAEKTLCFNHSMTDVFDKIRSFKSIYRQEISLSQKMKKKPNNLGKINEIVNIIKYYYHDIDEGNLFKVFSEHSDHYLDKYIKRMIISQIDIPELVYQHIDIYENVLTEEDRLLYISNALKENDFAADPMVLDMLFGSLDESTLLTASEFNTAEKIKRSNIESSLLAKGVLYSFLTPHEKLDIKEMSEEIQSMYGIERKRDSYFIDEENNTHIVRVNGQVIDSIETELVYPHLRNWQKSYEYAYDEYPDKEYVEVCAKIMSDMMLSQPFKKGNKRTAKSLFNAMLISRGIIPPVIDICENEYELWDLIADTKSQQYRPMINTIYSSIEEMNNDFALQQFDLPILVSPVAKRHKVKEMK